MNVRAESEEEDYSQNALAIYSPSDQFNVQILYIPKRGEIIIINVHTQRGGKLS